MLRNYRVIGAMIAVFVVIILSAFMLKPTRVCREPLTSAEDAKQAVATFFNSGSAAALDLAAQLHRDGMTDEYYERLKNECASCSISKESHVVPQDTDDNSWYAAVLIAPSEQKKAVILKVDCAASVSLNHTLYGG